MKYNGHEEIKDYDPKEEVYTVTKSRKTTFEERLEIIRYCLDHHYKKAAQEFQMPFIQVYQWVNKYLKKGEKGLVDGRGRRKVAFELTEIEKLKRDYELLLAKNKRLEMENEVLKK